MLGGKHVAIVSALPYPTHGQAEARGIGRELVRAGIRTTLICTSESQSSREIREPTVVPVGQRRGHLDDVPFTRAVAREIQRCKPDVVHVYAYRGCGLLPLLAPGPRFLFDLRSGNVSARPWSRLADRVTSWEARSYDARAAISRQVSEFVCKSWGDNASIIPLGCPTQDPRTPRGAVWTRAAGSSAPIRLGYVGSLDPQRKLGRLIDVAKRLVERKRDVTWIFLGDGPDRARLQQQAISAGVADRIEFRGHVANDAVWSHYAEMDVAVAYVPIVPHFYHQPPLKTLESMACGLPVIATNTAGNRDFITHGRDGLLVADDVEPIVSAVERLCDHPEERLRLGRAAVDRVADLGWERIVDEHVLPVYARLLS